MLAAALLVCWAILVEGLLNGWWYALLVVGCALLLRAAMPIPLSLTSVRVWLLFLFLPRFVWDSFIGGLDVAWRAFHPGLPIEPALYSYPFRVKSEGARVFLSQVISLMPGTLACCVGSQRLIVHVLSGSREDFIRETAAVELRAARIFGETLEESTHG